MAELSVVPWNEDSGAREFLEIRYATSMFLLGNLQDRGPLLADHPNSGNFKILQSEEETVGVFCLTRRGNLLLSVSDAIVGSTAIDEIFSACQTEGIPLKGVLGNFEAANAFRERAKEILPVCGFESREVLYQLADWPEYPRDARVRHLEAEDFAQWLPIRRAFTAEEGIKHDLSDEQVKEIFLRYSAQKEYWGLFEEDRMIATAALNARALDIGQVGGVYTLPEFRRRGLSKAVMRALLEDSRSHHGLQRMILFTGEKNIAAQKVYEGLGFERIGHFGIFLA